jgi:hypothetical protein
MAADWTDKLEVICADIGSIPQGRFAWARRLSPASSEGAHEPDSIEAMATAIIACLRLGVPVAVGFEMPLFLPVPEVPTALGKARPTDTEAPSWSSSTGASIMATGIVQAGWVLRRVFEEVPHTPVSLTWESFAQRREGLLVWEAFVTRTAKGETHEDDARIGLEAFCLGLPDPGDPEAMEIPRPLSLAAMVCTWAGWPVPAGEFRRSGVVARAHPSI